jgi:hypothetical protein
MNERGIPNTFVGCAQTDQIGQHFGEAIALARSAATFTARLPSALAALVPIG